MDITYHSGTSLGVIWKMMPSFILTVDSILQSICTTPNGPNASLRKSRSRSRGSCLASSLQDQWSPKALVCWIFDDFWLFSFTLLIWRHVWILYQYQMPNNFTSDIFLRFATISNQADFYWSQLASTVWWFSSRSESQLTTNEKRRRFTWRVKGPCPMKTGSELLATAAAGLNDPMIYYALNPLPNQPWMHMRICLILCCQLAIKPGKPKHEAQDCPGACARDNESESLVSFKSYENSLRALMVFIH